MFTRFDDPDLRVDKMLDYLEQVKEGEVFFFKQPLSLRESINQTVETLSEKPDTTEALLSFHVNVTKFQSDTIYNAVRKRCWEDGRRINVNGFTDIPDHIFNSMLYETSLTEHDIAIAVQGCITAINRLRKVFKGNNFHKYLKDTFGLTEHDSRLLAKRRQPKYHAFETWEIPTFATEILTEHINKHIEEIN